MLANVTPGGVKGAMHEKMAKPKAVESSSRQFQSLRNYLRSGNVKSIE